VARVVVVLDDLFGFAVTSGSVVVLEDRQFAPGDALCRQHHPLGEPCGSGGAVALPDCDTAQQDALDCASVKVCEGFG
jgi:hypothetical protein